MKRIIKQHVTQLLRYTPALLVVLTLAILNPLACLIHCAVVSRAMAAAHESSQSSRFFCGLPHVEQTESNEASRSSLSIPRVFYDFVPVAILFLLLQGRSILILSLPRYLTFSQTFFSPPTPPPRFV